jgi:phage-related protein
VSRSSAESTHRRSLGKERGAGVFEIVKRFEGNAYRVVYAVMRSRIIYVLHAFQKKSPRGSETARGEVAMVRHRLKVAKDDYKARYGEEN